MSHVTYRIVEHDGGWAYAVDGSYSETFPAHDAALKAARRAAREQRLAGDTHGIVYEDAAGVVHEDLSDGADRPETDVTG
ncbi:MAG: DUF2188 domain-containing protein [Caulobacterales bacterium]|jgi:hypothetical protein